MAYPFFGKSATHSSPGYATFILHHQDSAIAPHFGDVGGANFIKRVSHATADDFSAVGIEYIDSIRELNSAADHVTDKTPGNFRFCGLIKMALPNAKIIHCCRQPLDTCLSVFKNYFSAGGHSYACDLKELGKYYNLYRDLMKYWHQVLPGFIHDIHYEDLVADQEVHTRALLDYCGLEWDEACMKFYDTERPVRTASSVQVRRPINNNSIQSWKKFETQLSPLIEVVGREE